MALRCAALLLVSLEVAHGLWPEPHTISASGAVLSVTPEFTVTTNVSSAILTAAAQRYTTLIRGTKPPPPPPPQCHWQSATIPCKSDTDCSSWVSQNCHPASAVQSYCRTNGFCHFSGSALTEAASAGISKLTVDVKSDSEALTRAVDAAYSISIANGAASVQAETIYGAMHGLETFSQLVSEQQLKEQLMINDGPQYSHRGLMLDTGRRFVPIPLLESIVDGMSYSKLNVLHLHLSDEPAVRMQSLRFPELTAQLGGAFYTQQQLQSLVLYAKQRGVQIEPEIDVPAHAGGFQPLTSSGLKYCDPEKTTLSSDAGTLAVLDTLFQEVASVFNESEVIHFGADEACKHDVCPQGCTYDMVHTVEKHVQQTIKALGKVPMGWNDVFTDPKGSPPNAALKGTILQNWGKGSLSTFTSAGFRALDSSYQTMYLGEQCCRTNPPTAPHDKYSLCFYKDASSGVLPAQLQNVDGGEVALWSDNYCSAPHCAINGTYGWMYPSSQDAVFSQSYGNMVFPGAAAAAGSLWNYNSSLITSQGLPGTEFINSLDAHTERLLSRGVHACKPGCACDWGSACLEDDSQYYAGHATPRNMKVLLKNTGCDFNVHIKQRSPCSTLTGADIAVLKKGDSVSVSQDFIATGLDHAVEKDGDQFSIWVGDATWMNVEFALDITCDSTNYISMTMA